LVCSPFSNTMTAFFLVPALSLPSVCSRALWIGTRTVPLPGGVSNSFRVLHLRTSFLFPPFLRLSLAAPRRHATQTSASGFVEAAAAASLLRARFFSSLFCFFFFLSRPRENRGEVFFPYVRCRDRRCFFFSAAGGTALVSSLSFPESRADEAEVPCQAGEVVGVFSGSQQVSDVFPLP